MDDPLRSILLAPDTHDPFTLVVSEALLQTADRDGRNLVACPDDFLLQLIEQAKYSLKPGEPLTKSILWGLCPLGNTEIQEDDNWITVSPIDPLSATQTRADRTALGKFVRATEEKGYASIDECTAAAASMRTRVEPNFFQDYPSMLFAKNDLPSGDGLDLLRFYASLGSAAGEGKEFKVGELDSDQLSD